MPRRNTIRNRVLREFTEDEAQPKRCRLFRHAFIARARNLSAAGITSNGELATFFGVSASTVSNWRTQFPRFDQAVRGGAIELIDEMTDRAVDIARSGDAQMIRYLLDRRAPAFQPKSKLEHSGHLDTLEETLKRRAMTEDEARAKGLIYDEDEDGNRIDYEPDDDHEDEPQATQPQAPRRRAISDGDLRARGVLYDDEGGDRRKPGIAADPRRPYDFEKNRYR